MLNQFAKRCLDCGLPAPAIRKHAPGAVSVRCLGCGQLILETRGHAPSKVANKARHGVTLAVASPTGSGRLTYAPSRRQRGVTLIELMVGLAIFGLLVALAIPSYSAWIQNTQIRTAAESIVNGLQLARNEALRRNRSVELVLTADAPLPAAVDTIVPAAQGANWMVRVFETSDNYTQDPDFVQAWAGSTDAPNARLTTAASGGQETFRFSPLGRATFYKAQVATASPLPRTELRIEVSSSAASCKPGAGDLRCLTVQLSPGGKVRLCDPVAVAPSPAVC